MRRRARGGHAYGGGYGYGDGNGNGDGDGDGDSRPRRFGGRREVVRFSAQPLRRARQRHPRLEGQRPERGDVAVQARGGDHLVVLDRLVLAAELRGDDADALREVVRAGAHALLLVLGGGLLPDTRFERGGG